MSIPLNSKTSPKPSLVSLGFFLVVHCVLKNNFLYSDNNKIIKNPKLDSLFKEKKYTQLPSMPKALLQVAHVKNLIIAESTGLSDDTCGMVENEKDKMKKISFVSQINQCQSLEEREREFKVQED